MTHHDALHDAHQAGFAFGEDRISKQSLLAKIRILAKVAKMHEETLKVAARDGFLAARQKNGGAIVIVMAHPKQSRSPEYRARDYGSHRARIKAEAEKRFDAFVKGGQLSNYKGGHRTSSAARSNDRRGTNHKHPAGARPCPKCGV